MQTPVPCPDRRVNDLRSLQAKLWDLKQKQAGDIREQTQEREKKFLWSAFNDYGGEALWWIVVAMLMVGFIVVSRPSTTPKLPEAWQNTKDQHRKSEGEEETSTKGQVWQVAHDFIHLTPCGLQTAVQAAQDLQLVGEEERADDEAKETEGTEEIAVDKADEIERVRRCFLRHSVGLLDAIKRERAAQEAERQKEEEEGAEAKKASSRYGVRNTIKWLFGY
jgi:hypothetical protein